MRKKPATTVQAAFDKMGDGAYIWLDEYEYEGTAECGCRLVAHVEEEEPHGAAVYLCAMHLRAPRLANLVKAAKMAERLIESEIPYRADGWNENDRENYEIIRALRAAIKAAER